MMNLIEHYLNDYQRWQHELPGGKRAGIQQLRLQALHQFAEHGFPNRRSEDWKYMKIDPFAKAPFSVALDETSTQTKPKLRFSPDTYQILIINGTLDRESLNALPDSIEAYPVSEVLGADASPIIDKIRSYPTTTLNTFADLNTALMHEGLYLHVAPNTKIDKPIHIIHYHDTPKLASYLRHFIDLGEGSEATFIEHYTGPEAVPYYCSTMSYYECADNSKLEHIKLINEGNEACHTSHLTLAPGKDSVARSHVFTYGGRWVRGDTLCKMQKRGGESHLYGLYLLNSNMNADHHTAIHHLTEHTTSRQHYQGVLSDHAVGVFNGNVYVEQDAQHTDAEQLNKNLLLSKNATINTKPQLEIFADDVKCAHGATVGQLSEDALFYCQSRGLSKTAARLLLITAFTKTTIDYIQDKNLRESILMLIDQVIVEKNIAGVAKGEAS